MYVHSLWCDITIMTHLKCFVYNNRLDLTCVSEFRAWSSCFTSSYHIELSLSTSDKGEHVFRWQLCSWLSTILFNFLTLMSSCQYNFNCSVCISKLLVCNYTKLYVVNLATFTLKIADFGLALDPECRDYYISHERNIPEIKVDSTWSPSLQEV